MIKENTFVDGHAAMCCDRWMHGLDIHHNVTCMPRFRDQPRKGCLMTVPMLVGDLIACKTESIKFRTKIPDCSMFVKEQATHFDGSCICGEEKELVQKKWPEPKRKFAG